MSLRFSLLLVLAALWAPAARAQFAPGLPPLGAPDAPVAAPQTPAANDALAPGMAQMARDLGRGFYDDVIRRADALIEAAPSDDAADARLFYWRGMAFYRLAWYPEAVKDLTRARAGGVDNQPGGFPVGASLDKIAKVTPFIPPRAQAISNAGQVVFRVHYVTDNPQTRAVIGYLPNAYRASKVMFGSDVLATEVYIFDTYAQLAAFHLALFGRPMQTWIAAVTINGVLCLPLQDRRGNDTASYNPDGFRSTIAHEFNHAMLRRLMGSAELPDWLVEGLAEVAGGTVNPNDLQTNDYNIKRLFAVNALIPPQKLEDSNSFKDHTTVGAKLGDAGAGILAPSPYDQGYSMTRYLLANMKRGQLASFLNRVRESGDFADAFKSEFNASLPQFYQAWYGEMARRVRG